MSVNRRLAAAASAVGMAGSLAFAAGAPAASTESAYYLAGTRPPGRSSEVPETEWQHALPPSWSYPVHTVQYPREFAPFIGTKTVSASVHEGVRNTMTDIEPNYREGDHVTLVGVSQGAIVAHLVKREAVDKYGSDAIYEVLTYGDPTNPDGGLLTKTPRFVLGLLGLPSVNSADYPMATYNTTVAIRYDIIADAPDVPPWCNPLAWLNAVAGGVYYHHTYTFDQLQNAQINGAAVSTTAYYDDAGELVPAEDATRVATHFLIDLTKSANKGMPLTQFFRDIGLLLNNDAGDARVNAFWDHVDKKVVKPIVEAGYDHGANPGVDQREVSTTNGIPDEPVEQPAAKFTSDVAVHSSRGDVAGDDTADPVSSRIADSDGAEGLSGPEAIRKADAEARDERTQRRDDRLALVQQTGQSVTDTIDDVRDGPTPQANDAGDSDPRRGADIA